VLLKLGHHFKIGNQSQAFSGDLQGLIDFHGMRHNETKSDVFDRVAFELKIKCNLQEYRIKKEWP
jgi:hypothetical protein